MTKKTPETIVAFVLDKSGSMSSCADATRSGFNEYIASLQKDDKAKYSFSLTLFDTKVAKMYANESIGSVKPLTDKTYCPDGMTALYDAAMQTINETQQGLKKGQKVLFVVMTDGQENSSKEYTQEAFKNKVKELEAKGNWSFVFLGANQDAWATAQQFGFSQSNVAQFNSTGAGVAATFVTMAANTRSFASSAQANTASYFSKEDKENLSNAK